MKAQPYYDPEIRAALEKGPRLGSVNATNLSKIRSDRLQLNARPLYRCPIHHRRY